MARSLRKALFHALGPAAAGAFPPLSLLSSNLDVVGPGDAVNPLAFCVGVALALYVALAVMLRRSSWACLLVTGGALALFFYGPAVATGKVVGAGLYGGAVLVLGWLSLRLVRSGRDASRAADGAVVVACAMAGASLATLALNAPRLFPAVAATPVDPKAAMGRGRRPDIFDIVLDGYGRQDVLKERFGVDNAPFLAALRRRGFFVAGRSRANYLQTALSLASTLNMTYLDEVAAKRRDSQDRRPLQRMVQDSAVVRLLKDRGYLFVNVASGFSVTDINRYADVDLSGGFKEFGRRLLEMTPLADVSLWNPWLMEPPERGRVLFSFDTLQRIVGRYRRPTFVFAHVVSPHPPFVFRGDGSPLEEVAHWGMRNGDGDQYEGPREAYREGYAEQVEFVNRRILGVVDVILAAYPRSDLPVLILHADHGPGLGYRQNEMERSDLWERSSILAAFFIPPDLKVELDESITPVNVFRSLFHGVFGFDMGRLPDRTFFAPWASPYQHTEVPEAALASPCVPDVDGENGPGSRRR